MDELDKNQSIKYARMLFFLTGAFVFRVLAQLIQAISPIEILPAFDQWQSGALPYEVLLVSQVFILGLLSLQIKNLYAGIVKPIRRRGFIYLIIGAAYFGLMLFRLVAGCTFAVDHPWLGVKLPTVFHLVLASTLLLMAKFHYTVARARGAD